jgi:hypothetical protein
LKELLIHTIKFSKILSKKFNQINIIADNIKLDYKKEKIKSLLSNDDIFSNKTKFSFFF